MDTTIPEESKQGDDLNRLARQGRWVKGCEKIMSSLFGARKSLSRKFMPGREKWVIGAVLAAWFPGIAGANPVTYDPLGSLSGILRIAVVVVALAAEVALVSALLIRVGRVERRGLLVTSMAVLNIATYYLFIHLALPRTGHVLLIEMAIWLSEGLLIPGVARPLANRPIGMKTALAISLVGNLASFLVGLVL